MKLDIMGLQFDNVTMDEAAARAEQILAGDRTCYAVTPNAEIAYEALHDEKLRARINGAGHWRSPAGRRRRRPGREAIKDAAQAEGRGRRLCRPNLLTILEEDRRLGLYLLGGKPGIAEQAAENMKKTHPKLCICGTSGRLFQGRSSRSSRRINAARARRRSFVCLGAPKQELLHARPSARSCTSSLMIGLGGTLDGFAGTVTRAPKWMIRLQSGVALPPACKRAEAASGACSGCQNTCSPCSASG